MRFFSFLLIFLGIARPAITQDTTQLPHQIFTVGLSNYVPVPTQDKVYSMSGNSSYGDRKDKRLQRQSTPFSGYVVQKDGQRIEGTVTFKLLTMGQRLDPAYRYIDHIVLRTTDTTINFRSHEIQYFSVNFRYRHLNGLTEVRTNIERNQNVNFTERESHDMGKGWSVSFDKKNQKLVKKIFPVWKAKAKSDEGANLSKGEIYFKNGVVWEGFIAFDRQSSMYSEPMNKYELCYYFQSESSFAQIFNVSIIDSVKKSHANGMYTYATLSDGFYNQTAFKNLERAR